MFLNKPKTLKITEEKTGRSLKTVISDCLLSQDYIKWSIHGKRMTLDNVENTPDVKFS